MMKFFRKHNKKLLAVFMALLMVVFIGGTALEGLMTPRLSFDVGTSRFGKITTTDLEGEKNRITDILEFSGRNWRRPFSAARESLELVDWYLLTKECETMGIRPNVAELRAGAAGQGAMEQIQLLADRLRIRTEAVEQALAKFHAVQNAALAIGAATFPSDAELEAAARNALEKVQIRAAVIPAEALVELQESPTEEELQALFEKYREREPGEGLNFGYYRQPSAKVQYVRIDRDAITESIGVANLERKAKEYFEKNRTSHLPFRRHAGNYPEPPLSEDGATDSQDAEFLTWEEAKHIAIAAVKKQHADRAASELANWLVQDSVGRWLGAPRGEDGFREAREDTRDPDYFVELLKRVPPALSYPEAVEVLTTDFFTLDEAIDVPELGVARFETEGSGLRTFRSLVSLSKAFVPQVPEDAGARESDYLGLHQPCPRALRNPETGNYYVFRVVEAAPGRPAESLDEVREQVVADALLHRAFEAARRKAESLSNCAPNETLQDAYLGDLELGHYLAEADAAGFYEPQPFSRVPQMLASSGRPDAGIYVGAGVGRLPNDVADEIFALAESGEPRGIVELPGRATVLVVEIVDLIRAEVDEFNSLKNQLSQQIAQTRWQEAVSNWLDPEQIRARNGFEPIRQ